MELPYELHNVICPVCKAHLPAIMLCPGFSLAVIETPPGDRLEVFLCPECAADLVESEDPEDRTALAKAMLANTSKQPHLPWAVTTQAVIAEHHGDVLTAIIEGKKSDKERARRPSGECSNADGTAQS